MITFRSTKCSKYRRLFLIYFWVPTGYFYCFASRLFLYEARIISNLLPQWKAI